LEFLNLEYVTMPILPYILGRYHRSYTPGSHSGVRVAYI